MKKVHIQSKADWYQVEPECAAWVQELVIGSDVGPEFVIGEDGIEFGPCFPRLRKLSCHKSISQNELNLIERLPLEALSITMHEPPTALLMPTLKKLTLWLDSVELTPMDVLMLRSQTAREIDLSGCQDLRSLFIRNLCDLDLRCISALPNLRKLALYGAVLTDLSPLTALPLESLSLCNCYVEDAEALTSISSLRQVDLSYNQLETAAELCALPNLQTLNLRKNLLKDEETIRAHFRGRSLVISEHDHALQYLEHDITQIQYFANRGLFSALRKGINSPPPSTALDKIRWQSLLEDEYDVLLNRRILSQARRSVQRIAERKRWPDYSFDYQAYFVSRLRQEFPFLEDEELINKSKSKS